MPGTSTGWTLLCIDGGGLMAPAPVPEATQAVLAARLANSGGVPVLLDAPGATGRAWETAPPALDAALALARQIQAAEVPPVRLALHSAPKAGPTGPLLRRVL